MLRRKMSCELRPQRDRLTPSHGVKVASCRLRVVVLVWIGACSWALADYSQIEERGDWTLSCKDASDAITDVNCDPCTVTYCDVNCDANVSGKALVDLFYIVSPGHGDNGGDKAYHYATRVGISGDRFHGRFQGADFTIVDNPWLDKNIRTEHGPLGAEHPHTEYLMEGDTPSFLHIIPNGLSHPEHPDWGGWGGRYERYTPSMKNYMYEPEIRPIWTNAVDEVVGVDGRHYTSNHATIWRWRQAYQHDFAARIDWSNTNTFKKANHRPLAGFAGNTSRDIVHIKAKYNEKITLSAAGSTDPDGDKLSYKWFQYHEAGSLPDSLEINNSDKAEASVKLDTDSRSGTFHIILQVKDDGTPCLYSYRRVIISVGEKE